MSWSPFRREAPNRLMSIVNQSRIDLGWPELTWFVSQQPPTDDDSVNNIDVTAELKRVLHGDEHSVHVPVFDLPPQEKQLVIDTRGIVALGEELARAYLERR